MAAAAPCGHSSSPETSADTHPNRMSSTRTSPTSQPDGETMLKSTTTITVKAAWPAAKETAAGR